MGIGALHPLVTVDIMGNSAGLNALGARRAGRVYLSLPLRAVAFPGRERNL